MQFSTIINLLLALSAGALAFPASQDISNDKISTSIPEERDLEKRSDKDSIAAFAKPGCVGDPVGPPASPPLTSYGVHPCVPFDTQDYYIGINWGIKPAPDSPAFMTHFTDNNCTEGGLQMWQTNVTPDAGTDTCFEKGLKWKSVTFDNV